jgi:hypothetical protein
VREDLIPRPYAKLAGGLRAMSVPDALELAGAELFGSGHREEAPLRCPTPDHEDKSKRASVNTRTGFWLCGRCGAGGDLRQLLGHLINADAADALAALVRLDDEPTRGEGAEPNERARPGADAFVRFPVWHSGVDVPEEVKVDWIAFPLVADAGSKTLLVADPKIGKTTYALSMVEAIVNGRDFCGQADRADALRVPERDEPADPLAAAAPRPAR